MVKSILSENVTGQFYAVSPRFIKDKLSASYKKKTEQNAVSEISLKYPIVFRQKGF